MSVGVIEIISQNLSDNSRKLDVCAQFAQSLKLRLKRFNHRIYPPRIIRGNARNAIQKISLVAVRIKNRRSRADFRFNTEPERRL